MRRKQNYSKAEGLLKELKEIIFKYPISETDRAAINKICYEMQGKPGDKIKSGKLNNDMQNSAVKIYMGDAELKDLNMGHLSSTSGMYRRGRIRNKT